jgi:flagellar biosynthesis protein FliQ
MSPKYRSIVAGLALGALSLFPTFHLRDALQIDASFAIRVLQAAGVALVVPGLLAILVASKIQALRQIVTSTMLSIWVMAGVIFLFWFGFGWLFATFVAAIMRLRRAIASVGVSGGKSSTLGPG